jgi:hypothetical protein
LDSILTGLILIAAVSYLAYRAGRVLTKKEVRCCFGENYRYIPEPPRNGYNKENQGLRPEDGETSCGAGTIEKPTK